MIKKILAKPIFFLIMPALAASGKGGLGGKSFSPSWFLNREAI